MNQRIVVTGAAGFVGAAVAARLLEDGAHVLGIDSFNSYYDVALKEARWARLTGDQNFQGQRIDLADRALTFAAFDNARPTHIIHLAAQAGVRYGLENPQAYVDSNLIGFANVLEAARAHQVAHLVFASSSSVYGANRTVPFAENQTADHPMSLYAATKRSNGAGPFICAPVQYSLHGLAVLHGVWTVGPPGHGALQIHRAVIGGRTNRCASRRQHAPRLHLYRRHC